MLGRLRRTTRVDVGLALAFSGLAYLVWALVAGMSRHSVQGMINLVEPALLRRADLLLPRATAWVKVIFVDGGVAIDIAGLGWLAVSLCLVVLSSRQYFSISWVWVSAVAQSFVAATGAVLVAWGVELPYRLLLRPPETEIKRTAWEQVSGMSLPVVMVGAILVWVGFLVWLLVDRARLNRRGPTLPDGLKTNVFR